MNQNLRLGKIRGIPIGVNWSILLIFLLIAWELADLVLPNDQPHEAQVLYWAIGLTATAMFFACLLAHEVAHSIVAKRNGIGVRSITLWLFGGVSELEKDALTPGAELRIAAAGPLTSFVLAAVFGTFGLLFSRSEGSEHRGEHEAGERPSG